MTKTGTPASKYWLIERIHSQDGITYSCGCPVAKANNNGYHQAVDHVCVHLSWLQHKFPEPLHRLRPRRLAAAAVGASRSKDVLENLEKAQLKLNEVRNQRRRIREARAAPAAPAAVPPPPPPPPGTGSGTGGSADADANRSDGAGATPVMGLVTPTVLICDTGTQGKLQRTHAVLSPVHGGWMIVTGKILQNLYVCRVCLMPLLLNVLISSFSGRPRPTSLLHLFQPHTQQPPHGGGANELC
jgi:hypothetical protein